MFQVTWIAADNKGKNPFNPRPPNRKKLDVYREDKVASEAGAH